MMFFTLAVSAALAISPVDIAMLHVQNEDFDAAIACLEGRKMTERYNEHCLILASSYSRTNNKELAVKWAKILFESFSAPHRYLVVADLILRDSEGWKEDDIGDIARDMKRVTDRLKNSRSDAKTKEIQKEIIAKLDKLIKQKEDKANGMGGDGVGDIAKNVKGESGCPGGQKPMEDSNPGNDSGKGVVDEKRLKEYQKNWVNMTEHERARAISVLSKDLPPRYRVMIEDYFKGLNK